MADSTSPSGLRTVALVAVVVLATMAVPLSFAGVSSDQTATTDASTDWPTFGADAARTGHANTTGPTSDVTERWNFTTNASVYASPAVVDGTVYIGSWDENVYAIDAATGAERWNYSTDHTVQSTPAVRNGTVYVGSEDRRLYALDAATGAERWNYSTENVIVTSPAVVNDTVYVGSKDNNVYALDAATGAERWNFTAEDSVRSSPAVANGTVYVGADDNTVYAIDAATGSIEWLTLTGDDVASSPAVVNDTVYVGSNDGNVYALAAGDGTERWNVSTGDVVRSSPAVADGTVYVGNDAGTVYALDAATGAQEWTAGTGDRVRSSPAVADGAVYVGSWDHDVYAFDAASGAELWNFTTGAEVNASPAVVNGTLYVASTFDNTVWALTEPESTATPTPTPTATPTPTSTPTSTPTADASFAVSIQGTNSPVTEGETLETYATVENTGDETATQTVALDVGGVERDATNVTLAAGESTALTLTWGTAAGDDGEYTATVASEDDAASTTVRVERQTSTTTPPAEFTVAIDATNAPVTEPETLLVNATVENDGGKSDSQTVTLSANGSEQDATDVTLDGGQSTTVTLAWNTTFGDAGDYTATVASDDDAASTSIRVDNVSAWVEIENQTLSESGTLLVVDTIYLSEGGFVTIHDGNLTDGDFQGSLVGDSGYRAAGRIDDLQIRVSGLDLTTNQTIYARAYRDTDGNGIFNYLQDDVDGPYLEGGQPVRDSAVVRTPDLTPIPTPPPSATGTPTPTRTPTATPTATPSTTLEDSPTESRDGTEDDGPGFGPLVTLVTLGLVGGLWYRRGRQ